MAVRRGWSRFVRARRGTGLDVSEGEPSAAEVPDGLTVEASPPCRSSTRGRRVDAHEGRERFVPLVLHFDRVDMPCPAASTFRAAEEAFSLLERTLGEPRLDPERRRGSGNGTLRFS